MLHRDPQQCDYRNKISDLSGFVNDKGFCEVAGAKSCDDGALPRRH
jgi:hypothetical protein